MEGTGDSWEKAGGQRDERREATNNGARGRGQRQTRTGRVIGRKMVATPGDGVVLFVRERLGCGQGLRGDSGALAEMKEAASRGLSAFRVRLARRLLQRRAGEGLEVGVGGVRVRIGVVVAMAAEVVVVRGWERRARSVGAIERQGALGRGRCSVGRGQALSVCSGARSGRFKCRKVVAGEAGTSRVWQHEWLRSGLSSHAFGVEEEAKKETAVSSR